jgi:hypothetical protein
VQHFTEVARLTGKRRGGYLKREVRLENGEVTKYAVAYINPRVCSADNRRVLGYDNQHGYHHRLFLGETEPFEFNSYEDLVERFQREVEELWEKEDGK